MKIKETLKRYNEAEELSCAKDCYEPKADRVVLKITEVWGTDAYGESTRLEEEWEKIDAVVCTCGGSLEIIKQNEVL